GSGSDKPGATVLPSNSSRPGSSARLQITGLNCRSSPFFPLQFLDFRESYATIESSRLIARTFFLDEHSVTPCSFLRNPLSTWFLFRKAADHRTRGDTEGRW